MITVIFWIATIAVLGLFAKMIVILVFDPAYKRHGD